MTGLSLGCSALAQEVSAELVAKAKQEGRVTYYTDLIVNQIVRPLTAAFEAKYGIRVEFTRADSQDTILKLLNEQRAGRVTADVFSLTTGFHALVNAGAITTTSMVKGNSRDAIWKSIQGYLSDFAGRPLSVNTEVFNSEAATNQRNQAIASLMYAYGHIKENPARATDIYTEQCAVNVNAKDLAMMAATLANGGKNPVTGKQCMKSANVPKVLAVMATAGLYDDSGKWLFHTGLPGKSGVGGGLIAVSPGKFGIGTFAPPLDAAGNSVRGQKAITDISNALGGNPYASKPV